MLLVVQRWTESERGWGQRPDGYSVHRSHVDRDAFVQAYWDSMPDETPDEYSRPEGSPVVVRAAVSADLESAMLADRGARVWQSGPLADEVRDILAGRQPETGHEAARSERQILTEGAVPRAE